ncbi:right-handed parallel beta-helix repeat-containing protein [Herbiconiux sp. P18]|uniref:right-handed parallel beta-helix repeat-containing protein n=1 Tax=Herbiconiux liangxiaofengii TaxID=3342795 RepID=UPI0035B8C80A
MSATRAGWVVAAVLGAAVVVTLIVVFALRPNGSAGGADAAPNAGGSTSTPAPAPAPGAPGAPSAECSGATETVSTSSQLQTALDDATPGAVIMLSPGQYPGNFTATTSGTAEAPIRLCGGSDSVLDGGRIDDGYVLHLDAVSNWEVSGFAIRNGQKGLMADGTTDTLIQGLTVSNIGDEAIHLRGFSSDNTVSGNTISDTGQRKPQFGEGVYIGTAESNWCDITDCDPDASDRNIISDNTFRATTAENIDIKEGTTGGEVSRNTFDGSALVEDDGDSWVDVKGNDWVIENNIGTDSPQDGFQVHEIVDGWGTRNVFRANVAQVDGPGFGYSITPERENVVECSNSASGAGEGLSNMDCTPG